MIKDKKLLIAFYSVVMAAIYPLIYFMISNSSRSDSTDAAGRGMEALGILITVFIAWIAYFFISIIFSRIFLRTFLPPIIAPLLFLLGYEISEIPDYIDSLPKKYTEYYENGKVKKEGKRDIHYGHWVGLVKSYRRDATLWKEEKYPSDDAVYRIYTKYYYGDGTLKSEGFATYEGLDARIGEWKFYKPDGTLDDVRTYDGNDDKITSSKKYRFYTDGVYIYHIGSGNPFTGMLKNTPVVYCDNNQYFDEESTYPRENEEDEEEISPDLYTCKVKDGVKLGKLVIRYAAPGHPLAYQTFIHNDGSSWDAANVYYPNGQIREKVTLIDDSTKRYEEFYQDSIKRRAHGMRRFTAKYTNGYVRDTAYWYNNQGKLRAWAIFKKGEVIKQWPQKQDW